MKRFRKTGAGSASGGPRLPAGGLIGMLRRRGLEPIRVTQPRDLLRPAPSRRKAYYERLKNYSFRLVLRDIIRRPQAFRPEDLIRFCSLAKVREHLAFLSGQKLIGSRRNVYRLIRPSRTGPIRSFGGTLEWFVARMFELEFGAEVLWGVRFRNGAHGGDYDLAARVEGDLVYVEVKSSPPKHIEQREVDSFLDRIEDLLPHLSFFFVDTQLRMKDKIVVMFEQALRARHGRRAAKRYPVARLCNELFQINHQVYLVNSKRDVAANFRVCFRDYWRSRIRI